MLNFRLSWPAGLRSSSPASTSAGDTPATTTATPATGRQTAIPAGSFPLASSSSSSSSIRSITRKDKAHKATGVPASVRYFAIFDPRPPPSKKNKGKERAQDNDEEEQEEQQPSTTVLFYSSPSEPTTTQTTIQRKLGLASAIVHFSSELNNVASSTTTTTPSLWPNADTQNKDLPRWSVTASKTRTLTLRVRPFVYLHVVVDLPRLPRQIKPAATLGKDGKGAAVKWEYVSNGVADEAVFEAMAQAWTSFVDRNGERPTHSESTIDDGEVDDDDEEEKYHRALEKFFMPWVLTWDLPSSSFPNQPKLSSTSTTGTIRNNPTTTKAPSSSLRKSITAAAVGTGSGSSRPSSIHSTKESSRPSSSSASTAALTAALG
ncbi:hypothetical protein CF319_g3071 [Tilletia indica]|nr:hypothetical protein CF319_g3071 [Tilletia indica]